MLHLVPGKLLEHFPKELIVGCFSQFKFSMGCHIPKLQKAFSKCVRKQNV